MTKSLKTIPLVLLSGCSVLAVVAIWRGADQGTGAGQGNLGGALTLQPEGTSMLQAPDLPERSRNGEASPEQHAVTDAPIEVSSLASGSLSVIEGQAYLDGRPLNAAILGSLDFEQYSAFRRRLQKAASEATMSAFKLARGKNAGIMHSSSDYITYGLEHSGGLFLPQRVTTPDGATESRYFEVPQEYAGEATAYSSVVATMDALPMFGQHINARLRDFEDQLKLKPGDFTLDTDPRGRLYTYWGLDGEMLGQVHF